MLTRESTPEPTRSTIQNPQNLHRVKPNPGVYTTTPKIGWIVWVFYDGPKPAHITRSSIEGSGFTITVWDKNGRNITDRITNQCARSSGDRGDSLQFFVKTFLDENPKDGTDDDGVDGDAITVQRYRSTRLTAKHLKHHHRPPKMILWNLILIRTFLERITI